MGFNNVFFENYDPRNHPCKDCIERSAECHGKCERYKAFNEQRPKKPINLYHRAGKMRDTFHKKGRVIRRGT